MNRMDYSSDVSMSSSEISDVFESPIDDLSGIGPYSYEPDASNMKMKVLMMRQD